ncbi:hypothetical protein ACSTB4_11615, partial [Faecalibacterium duncaniae]
AQHAIACVLCELLCLELFNVFFQHENRFRYKFFDIVQFSRSCVPQPCGRRLDYFTTEVIFCQALFFRSFSIFSNLWFVFQRIHIGSFALLLPLSEVILSGGPWRSSIIPHPQPSVNTFLHLF